MKSDFSAFALWTAGLSWLTQAYAYTQPVGDTPSGNPIYTPGLNEIVPAGSPYKVTWNATTSGTVTLVLLRGPSDNVKPLYAIVEKIANDGSYEWTPSTSLEPDTTHYGLEIIDDANGQYQYSTQFGISNPSYSSSSSSSATASATASSSVGSLSHLTNSTANATITSSAVGVASTGFSAGSGNVTLSKSMSVPASLLTSTVSLTTTGAVATATGGASGTSSSPAVATGAAGRMVGSAGAVVGALAAVVAFAA